MQSRIFDYVVSRFHTLVNHLMKVSITLQVFESVYERYESMRVGHLGQEASWHQTWYVFSNYIAHFLIGPKVLFE